ncbi:MAG: hypothetical protein AAB686_00975, partial [Patescibacteria group bacterium]
MIRVIPLLKFKNPRQSASKDGQSTIEVLIALLILVAALSGAVIVIFGGQSLTIDSGESNRALRLAEENLET